MMVKPEGADEGEAKPLEPPPVNTADDPEGEDAEAMDALLGVGSDLSGAAPAAPHRNGDTRADAAPPRALERVKSQEKNAPSRAHSPKGSPARCANPTSAFLLRPPTTPVRVPPTLPPPRLPRFAPILAPSLRSSSLVSPAAVPITSPRDPRSKPPKDPTPETADPNDMDESAKMLMLLGELGGHVEDSDEGDSDAGDDSGNDSQGGAAGKSDYPRNVSTPKRKNAKSNAGGSNAGAAEATAAGMNRVDANVSGPVGEWLRAEGEARMKMADHRRLIYRWTNAIYRLLGMKIPRGMGSLFDKGEKNKREKFDRFLSYYYGTETFEPGTYWYNNADTIQFFIELIRIATRNRYVPEPITIQKLFRKKDPTRQASTWIMVQEELDKTDVSAAELRSLFEGPPRVEGGFPRGRPLFVPIPKNPKGHHKYNKSGGEGGESVPNSPNPAPKKERRERGDATPRRGAARAPPPPPRRLPTPTPRSRLRRRRRRGRTRPRPRTTPARSRNRRRRTRRTRLCFAPRRRRRRRWDSTWIPRRRPRSTRRIVRAASPRRFRAPWAFPSSRARTSARWRWRRRPRPPRRPARARG